MENAFKNLLILARQDCVGPWYVAEVPVNLTFNPDKVTFYGDAHELLPDNSEFLNKALSLLTMGECGHTHLILIEFTSGSKVIAACHEYGLGDTDLFEHIDVDYLDEDVNRDPSMYESK